MKNIYLDGRYMYDKKEAERYICAKLNISEEITDIAALKYILEDQESKLFINFYNEDIMLERLGSYGQEILDTFYDISVNFKNISFGIIS